MKIFAIDSSAKQASCAFVQDGRILMEAFINVALTHSQTLMPMVENMCGACRLSVRDADIFAVSNGPGSFTGVRIGISALKGMAAALGKPCMGVSTLAAMAENLRLPFDFYSCAVMDARRNQVYNAVFRHTAGQIFRMTEDRAISVAHLFEDLKKYAPVPIILVGDAADLCYNNSTDISLPLQLPPEHLKFARAAGVALAAMQLYDPAASYDAADLTPNYLRLSQAEREKISRESGN